MACGLAGLDKQEDDVLTEDKVGLMLLRLGQSANELGNFLGLAQQMGEAGLTVGRVNGIVGSIVISDEASLEMRAEDLNGDITGAGVIDLEEIEIGITGEPDV